MNLTRTPRYLISPSTIHYPLLQRRFQQVTTTLANRLQKLSLEQLETLVDVAVTAESLQQFTQQMPRVTPIRRSKTGATSTQQTGRTRKTTWTKPGKPQT